MNIQNKEYPTNIDQFIAGMLFDPHKEISKSNIKQKYFIDTGSDSLVAHTFGFDDKNVWKFYGSGAVPDTDKTHEEWLNLVSIYQTLTNSVVEYCASNVFVFSNLPLRINPINGVYDSKKYRRVIGSSPFIGGDKLSNSAEMKLFCINVNDTLNTHFGVFGIHLSSYNMLETSDALIAVDICSNLDLLVQQTPYPNYQPGR